MAAKSLSTLADPASTYVPPDFELLRRAYRFEINSKRPGTVYFIGSGDGGPVKIGFTTNLRGRLEHLQTASPVQLTVLASVDGSPGVEWDYHERFREHLVRGEWFSPHEDILAEIARLHPTRLSTPA